MNSQQHSFQGQWITAEEFCNLKPVNVFHRQLEPIEINSLAPKNSHILFRKKFKVKSIEKTYIFISADDYYKLYINGKFVCQGPAPGYPFHYYYNKVDISDYIKVGQNVIAVHTYYQGLINRVWVSGDDRHGLILDIVQDGKTILSSDESFLYDYHSGFEAIGKYGIDTQFAQKYISGTKQENFFEMDYDDSQWKRAKTKRYVDYELFEQPTKMLVFEDIKPFLTWDEKGVTADFGAIYVGYLCAQAEGEKGQTIELLFGQELNDDGSVRWKLRANCDYRELWQLSGGNDALNEYDYKTFRYARLNIPPGCKVKNIYLKARHYPFELKVWPNVDDPQLLKVWDLCIRSLKYGAQEVIMDCMEREKGNYLGDGCYTALAYAIVTKDASPLKKLFDDSLRSSFINKGLMTCAACSFMQEIAEYPLMMFYSMYSYYKLTGDKEYLAEKYDQLCEVLDYYKENYMQENGLLSKLDKWCVVEWPKEYRDGYDAQLIEGKV
ncbi:MAG: family 78 glycoside hydrolase catalytic domain, partial [Eubacteriales bacterium]|nr:family 78 glycoside hydrolase catalytic domain [Eubacteriales bacterium]